MSLNFSVINGKISQEADAVAAEYHVAKRDAIVRLRNIAGRLHLLDGDLPDGDHTAYPAGELPEQTDDTTEQPPPPPSAPVNTAGSSDAGVTAEGGGAGPHSVTEPEPAGDPASDKTEEPTGASVPETDAEQTGELDPLEAGDGLPDVD